jgi:hypothetical protein
MKSRSARPIFACIAALATGLGPLTATEFGSGGILEQVNLVGSKNSNGQWILLRRTFPLEGAAQLTALGLPLLMESLFWPEILKKFPVLDLETGFAGLRPEDREPLAI